MSPDVAQFLRALLIQQHIEVSNPEMLEVARLAAEALEQLDAVLGD